VGSSPAELDAVIAELAPVAGVRVGSELLASTSETPCSGRVDERVCVADDSAVGVAAADPSRRVGCYASACTACDARKYAPLAQRRAACYAMLEGREAQRKQRYAAVIVTRPDLSVPAHTARTVPAIPRHSVPTAH
jgi:hypothetical protein